MKGVIQMSTINFKTLTSAYRGRETLRRAGIMSEVVSVDPSKTRRGCSYALVIDSIRAGEARRALVRGGVDFGDIS